MGSTNCEWGREMKKKLRRERREKLKRKREKNTRTGKERNQEETACNVGA